MHRIPLLSLFGWLAWPLGALAAAVAGAGLEVDHRPNIVIILMDDLRRDELGCVGHPFVKTPHIDRIGREGAIFRNAFATTPLRSPSRASIQ
ncbi:MAG: arylsulfatase [Chloroflexota bacterium]|jgi:arylsulfatase A-like enzyme|nr:arylsulfatase [Chloroflexota bacterium]